MIKITIVDIANIAGVSKSTYLESLIRINMLKRNKR